MTAFEEIIAMYTDIWESLNIFGKILVFPYICLLSPILYIVTLCFKRLK
jgi:hypothetical protein